eukprot:6653524-Pyramimonas_sp.AAC.1
MCEAKPTADASCLLRGARCWSASRTAARNSRQRSVFSGGAVIMHSTVSNTQPIQVCRRAGARMPCVWHWLGCRTATGSGQLDA